jgi:phosphoribosylanthranilate isomerase
MLRPPMNVKVKICGLTSVEDALAAVEAGADALGFMFYAPSPRCVAHKHAAAIIRALPALVAKVGVFVNPAEDDVRRAVAESGIDTLQFHGDEPPEFCLRFGLKAMKAFRVQGPEILGVLPNYSGTTWLLDSFVAGTRGGTGNTFNWEIAAQAVKLGGRVVLAGGLTPENAAEAVRVVRPYALDVSSGVESAPGRKDAAKVRAFIAAARSV